MWKKNRGLMSIYFGYDPAHDTYKVICLRIKDNGLVDTKQQLLTLGVGCGEDDWRTAVCSISHLPVGINSHGIWNSQLSINGFVYYLSKCKLMEQEQMVLMCFDLASEEFTMIEISDQEVVQKYFHEPSMIPLNGKLAFSHMDHCKGLIEFLVLESNHEWSMMSEFISLDMSGWGVRYGKDGYNNAKNLRFLRTLGGELVFYEQCIAYLVLSYDPKKKETKRIEASISGKYVNREGSESPIRNYINRYIDPLGIDTVSLDHHESVPRLPSFTRPRLLNSSA